MGGARLSFRLEPELKAWIEDQAERSNRSAGYIVTEALRLRKSAIEEEDRIIAEALAEADKGVFISEEAVTRWVMSWGADNELPMPKPDIFPEVPLP
jgi:predicted transcriptional regulator